MGTEQNCCCKQPVVLGVKKSPFSGRMGAGPNPHSSQARKYGDESSTEAASVTAPAVVDGAPAAVSHASGLEAGPTGRAAGTLPPPVGHPALGDHHAGPDLGCGRLARREVRDGRGYYVASHEARKRPGKILQGFHTKSGKFALLFHGLCRLGKIDWASESHQELDRCLSRTITASKNFND